jgi:hypothetical protein
MPCPGFVRLRVRLVVAATSFAAAGCGSGSVTETSACTTDCTTGPPPQTGTLSISVAPDTIDVAPGDSGTAVITVVRGGSYTEAVSLTAQRIPPGLSVTFDPNPVPPGSTTSTVTATSISSRPGPVPSSLRDTPSGTSSNPRPDIAFIRSRHAVGIKAVGHTDSARTTVTVLCASSCEAP